MIRYRRNFVAGGTYFFTATLVDRKSSVLIDHVEGLHAAMRATRREHTQDQGSFGEPAAYQIFREDGARAATIKVARD